MPTATPADVRGLIQAIISLPIYLVVLGVTLFWPAGSLSWGRGWWFLAAILVVMAATIAYIWRVNPEIFVARSRIGSGTKGFDLLIVPVILAIFMAIPVIGGLDDGRFRWTPTPDWVVWLGDLLLAAGFALTAWALKTNRHFEPTVRIQTDRGHKVIDTGPYAFIRHPGYAAGILLVAGYALGVGSLWALIPGVLFLILLAYRTLREEETLRAGLAGYTEYAERVRYRWVPGIW